MNVDKIIRVIGYIVYTAIWSPIIILAIVATPIMVLATDVRVGRSIRGSIDGLKNMFIETIQHDMEFIQTGKW